MRIEGILLPADWSEDGQVTALILATSDEAELPLHSDKAPSQFEPYFRKKVIVDGDLATSGCLKIKAIGFYEVDLESVGHQK